MPVLRKVGPVAELQHAEGLHREQLGVSILPSSICESESGKDKFTVSILLESKP
jgi:hypothetical protein